MSYILLKDAFGVKVKDGFPIIEKSKNGYVMKAGMKDGEWIGLPKSIVENNPEWFLKWDEIKPCPFCGSEAITAIDESDEYHKFYVMCKGCFSKTDCHLSTNEAIKTWNKRAK